MGRGGGGQGVRQKGGTGDDSYASRCPSFPLTDLNNSGYYGEGNSNVDTTSFL